MQRARLEGEPTAMTKEQNLATFMSGEPEAIRKIAETLAASGATGLSVAGVHPGIRTVVLLGARDGVHDVRLQLTYSKSELDYAEIGEGDTQQVVEGDCIQSASQAAIQAAKTLRSWGFKLVHADTGAIMPVFMFVRGKQIPGKEVVIGINAQLTTLDMTNGFGHGE